MATDYISREAAIRAIIDKQRDHTTPWRLSYELGKKHAADEYVDAIKSVPAADVRPVVRGRWEKHEDFDSYGGGRFVEWVCSECDKRLRGDWATRNHIEETPAENFCPNCGADMREVL